MATPTTEDRIHATRQVLAFLLSHYLGEDEEDRKQRARYVVGQLVERNMIRKEEIGAEIKALVDLALMMPKR